MKYNVQTFDNNYLKYSIQVTELSFNDLDKFTNLIVNMDPSINWKYIESEGEQWLIGYDWKILNAPGEYFDHHIACTIHNRLKN